MTDDPHAAKLDAVLEVLHRHKIPVLSVPMTIRHGKSTVQYSVETEPVEADGKPERTIN